MTREIKFRAWDSKDIKMFYVTLEKLYTRSDELEHEFHAYEWMQYTGLKDKNGKEIYEGDIILAQDGLKYEIGFHDGAYRAKTNSGLYTFHQQYSEITGNIYENPELLSSNTDNTE